MEPSQASRFETERVVKMGRDRDLLMRLRDVVVDPTEFARESIDLRVDMAVERLELFQVYGVLARKLLAKCLVMRGLRRLVRGKAI